jgi:putative ABC transport system permease protein
MLLCLLLTPGEPTAAQQHEPIPRVAVEQQLARELHLVVGDTIRIGSSSDAAGQPFVVGALYRPRADPAEIAKGERHIRMHLPDLAALLGAPDRVDRLSIGIPPGISADSAAAALNRSAYGYRVYTSRAIASQSSQTFRVVSRFHRAIAAISIVASTVFLLCIMLLKVEERRQDAAMMRFVGVRRRTIFGALLLEALVIAAVGSLLGTGLAYLAGAATNAYYRQFFNTTLTFSIITPELVSFSVAISLIMGTAAGALAAWRLVRTPPLVLWGRG